MESGAGIIIKDVADLLFAARERIDFYWNFYSDAVNPTKIHMIIRAAREGDAPAMGQFLVETWLAAHKGQVPEGQWLARRKNWTPEKSPQGWAETLLDMGEGKSPDYCVYLAVDTAEPPEIVGMVMGGAAQVGPWPEAGEIYDVMRDA